MSLRYAILGFLSSTPSTGYDLGRAFSSGAGQYWEASSSQIYPELKRLEKERLIEGKVSRSDRLNRCVYRLTIEGQNELLRWVESEIEYPPRRDPERIQLLFLDRSDRSTIRRHIDHHRRHYERTCAVGREILQAILDRSHPRLIDRLGGRDRREWNLIVGLKRLAAEADIRRAETEIKWCDEALKWLNGLTPQDIASGDGERSTGAKQPKKALQKSGSRSIRRNR
jgi:PadR family transcriptional regulator AphA